MSPMLVCQILVVVMLVLRLLVIVKHDIEGVDAKKPTGFPGAIATIVAVGLHAWLLWGAGAFTQLLPR